MSKDNSAFIEIWSRLRSKGWFKYITEKLLKETLIYILSFTLAMYIVNKSLNVKVIGLGVSIYIITSMLICNKKWNKNDNN